MNIITRGILQDEEEKATREKIKFKVVLNKKRIADARMHFYLYILMYNKGELLNVFVKDSLLTSNSNYLMNTSKHILNYFRV